MCLLTTLRGVWAKQWTKCANGKAVHTLSPTVLPTLRQQKCYYDFNNRFFIFIKNLTLKSRREILGGIDRS
jgi:hypothetical protein